MASKGTFRELIVWQKAVQLAVMTYQATQVLPPEERYGLTSQMRRSAVSIASNIAEGNARQTRRDYLHFLGVARGSLAELETQITIASQLTMLRETDHLLTLLQETRRILQGLIDRLREPPTPQT